MSDDSSSSASEPTSATKGKDYEERLSRLQGAAWKRWLDVQAPFRWHLQGLRPGFMLDIGCGIGRTLLHVRGHGVGVYYFPPRSSSAWAKNAS